MTIQRRRRFLPFVLGHRTACHSVSSLMLLALLVMGLPALSGAQQVCQPDGDVDRNGSVTAADALLAFQQALGLTQLTACQRDIADVFPQPASPDGSITASDALCIFQKALSLPSCLDTLSSTNQPPIADAGVEQFVFGNEVVMLTGSGNDADGTVVRYRWEQTSGPPVVLSGADTPNVNFIAPEVTLENLVEELEFQLTVTDDDGASGTAIVLVVVLYGSLTNEPPTADAGFDQMVSENILVTLSGSGSDPDGIIIAYNWLQMDGTPVLLFDADTPNPSFFAPEVDSEEELVFELAVFDDELAFATDTVTITVLNGASNTPPVADAGRDQTVDEDTPVTLSGSGTDSDGTVVSYRWTQTSGMPVALSGANTRTASFAAPDVDSDEALVFQLMVTDDVGASDTDAVTVTVRAAPASSGLREMVFQNPGPRQPNYVIVGDNAGLQYWTDPDGAVSQMLYEKADGTQRVRIFYDGATGTPRTVLNEISGHWLSIREAGPNRVDFWAYDGAGSYLGGFAVYENFGEYYMGEIVGVPAHEWNEITGQLNPADSSWTGSFTLMGDREDGLRNITAVPPELINFVDVLSPTDSRLAGNHQVIVTGLDDHQVVVAELNATNTSFTLGAAALGTGVAVSAGVIAAPAIVAAAPALVIAGAAGVAGSFYFDYLGDGLRNGQFAGDCGSSCRDLHASLANFLNSPDDAGGMQGFFRDAVDGIENPSRLFNKVANGNRVLANMRTGLLPKHNVRSRVQTRPASLIAPPTVGGSLFGQAQGQGGSSVPLRGTIGSNGSFTVTGTGSQGRQVLIRASVGPSGAVNNGTFNWGSQSGNIPQSYPPGTPVLWCLCSVSSHTTFLGWTTRPSFDGSGPYRACHTDNRISPVSKASCQPCLDGQRIHASVETGESCADYRAREERFNPYSKDYWKSFDCRQETNSTYRYLCNLDD